MTYLLLDACFLIGAALAAMLLTWRTPRIPMRAVILAAAALIILTAIFDTVMISVGLFTYADDHLAGPRIGKAPIEDFAYPIAALILLPAIWMKLETRHAR